MKTKRIINTLIATVLAIFALLTLYLSSSVIFDWFDIRAKEGNYVLFIVWTNFICSILYLVAVYGFLKRKRWTFWVLIVALVVLIVAFAALLIHINNGGVHEEKTIGAMLFRISLTLTFSLVSLLKYNKKLWKN